MTFNPARSRTLPRRQVAPPRSCTALGAALLTVCALSGCQPNLDLGKWTCSPDGAPNSTDTNAPVAVPWSTGFENQFCDYIEVAGFCYDFAPSSYQVVTSPVHSGQYAAAFSVDSSAGGNQARCVRQGALPADAYYSAWYYIPISSQNTGNWNLFHFTGGTDLSDPSKNPGWLDVSLLSVNGALQPVVYAFARTVGGNIANPPSIPIGSWFHLQLRVKRAANNAGEIALYQDGQAVFDATNVMTDNSPLGSWYVGNLANALTPAVSTVYVDDVTISAAL